LKQEQPMTADQPGPSIPAHLGRRTVLAAGAGFAAALAGTALAGTGPAAAATPALAGSYCPPAQRRAYTFLDAMLDAYLPKGETRLPQSYADQLGLFSTAFVYDSALTLLAYLSDRRPGALARARVIGDALLFCQENDPQHTDGRLRQAYNVGPYTFYDGSPQPDGLVRADGKANVGSQFGFLGTAVGDMAWVGMALANLAHRTRDARYRAGAVRIGEWIFTNTSIDQPLSGYRFGVDGANNILPFTSTEHNIDVLGLFAQLHRLTGNPAWQQRRERAMTFLRNMWEPTRQFFWTGTNDGATINTYPIPEDPQSWSFLSLRSRRYEKSIDYAIANLTATDTATSPNSRLTGDQRFTGITFSSHSLVADPNVPISQFDPKPDPDAVWFEGTAHIASALRERGRRGDEARAARYLHTIERAQDQLGAGQTVGGQPLPERSGVVAASSPLHTGFGFGYFNFRHVGATSWYLMAANRNNPFTL